MKHRLEQLFLRHNVVNLAFDSREIKDNYVFFAITGNNLDGNDYIDNALKNGASLIFTDNNQIAKNLNKDNVVFIPNIRESLAVAATIFYPKLPKYILAVTGTNGKTSVAHYVQQFIELMGSRSASIGTLGICGTNLEYINELYPNSLTTPDPITLHKILNHLADNDIDYVIMEAASHGIKQKRLFGINMQACAFTSFSQDHLDYHLDLEDYLLAKLKLFTENLPNHHPAIINGDMHMAQTVIDYLKENNKKLITVGRVGDLKINQINFDSHNNMVSFTYKNKDYQFTTNIIGDYQIYNILIAVLLVHETGFSLDAILKQLPKLKPPIGRLEAVTTPNIDFKVFIDYAHTPDAIKQALQELKKINTNGKLKILFGCGGDRDQSKRKIMGEIASKFADEVIVTDDNPRTEDSLFIRQQILEGTSNNAIEISDRKQAIVETILKLEKYDILLIAGKGHENYQIIGNEKISFSDILIAKEAIKQKYDLEQ